MTPDDAHVLLARLVRRISPGVVLGEAEATAFLEQEAELDSMDFLELVSALEEETGIDVPDRDHPLVATVDGFVDHVTDAGRATLERP